MTLSIETFGGKSLVEEKFYYDAVDQIINKTYQNVQFPSEASKKNLEIPKKKEKSILLSYYTVQVYARTVREEAFEDSSGLNSLGFEDVFIEKFIKDDIDYWRVRTGKFNTIKKAEKRKKEISKVLKIDLKKLWAVEVK